MVVGDQTTGRDHGGISVQPDLPAVDPLEPVRDAQASSGLVSRMANRKPSAALYIMAAIAIAAIIWTTIGAPHVSLKTVKQKHQYAGRVAVP